MNLTAHMSDFHQNENFLFYIDNLHPETRHLVVHGDFMQCHKNRRPSKGRIKGLPGVDNGFGEEVQKWALEAAAYINHGTPIPKGETVDFATIPSGVLRTDTENYEVMHNFLGEVVADTKERMLRVAEACDRRWEETGMRTTVLFGHDNAYDMWIRMLFPEMDSIRQTMQEIEMDASRSIEFVHGRPRITLYKWGRDVGRSGEISTKDSIGADTVEYIVPLSPLISSWQNLAIYTGKPNLDVRDSNRQGGTWVKNGALVTNELESKYFNTKRDAGILSASDIGIICVNSHEGPTEVSDVVMDGKGKATEERTMFENIFSNIPSRGYEGKVLWIYGNDGEPRSVTKDINYAGCDVRVHHLAELDEKGNPDSLAGDVTYVNQSTAELLRQDYQTKELVPLPVMK